jgi:transcriptional regulator with GAF, ATPase, and Fis domain
MTERQARAALDVQESRMAVQLIASSRAFRHVLDAISMIAPVDSRVRLLGGTGTGRELVARAIHDSGPRRSQRFVAVNCAAIPDGLLESELFGYERGAFTGAATQTIGRFQHAGPRAGWRRASPRRRAALPPPR